MSILTNVSLFKQTGLRKKGGAAPPTGVPSNTGVPTISGVAQSGQTLSATTGNWTQSPTSFAYQWAANGTNIVGATGASYTLADTEVGKTVTVSVVASNIIGPSASPATSAPTSTVLPAAPTIITLPVISGTAQSGQTLSTTNGTWNHSPTGYTYQWYANSIAIGGATSSTFLLTDTQIGALITVAVVATNAGGSSSPATSSAVGPVIASGGGGSTNLDFSQANNSEYIFVLEQL